MLRSTQLTRKISRELCATLATDIQSNHSMNRICVFQMRWVPKIRPSFEVAFLSTGKSMARHIKAPGLSLNQVAGMFHEEFLRKGH